MSKTQLQWTVAGKSGFDDLKLNKEAPIPQLGDKDVLVKCRSMAFHFGPFLQSTDIEMEQSAVPLSTFATR